MGTYSRNWRIILASLFSVGLVCGAAVIARSVGVPPVAEASTETALLKAIATKDSTGDGLPDWQKVLYGIPLDATTTDYFNLGMTDGEAVARGLIVPKAVADLATASTTESTPTLTSAFAQYFFTLYLTAKESNGGAELTNEQTSEIATAAFDQLMQTVSTPADAKTPADIVVHSSGPAALKVYAATAEKVLKKNYEGSGSTATVNEMGSMQNLVENEDEHARTQLLLASEMYRNYASDLLAVPVPEELAKEHLDLVNLLFLRSTVDADLAHVSTDPLAAMVALQRFLLTESTFWNIFTSIGAQYASSSIELPAGTPGASFVNLVANFSRTTQP